MILNIMLWLTGITGLVAALVNALGVNIYDIRSARLQHNLQLKPYSRQYKHRPLITVVIWARNDANRIKYCLESTLKNYRKTEVIIVDMASTDNTRQVIKQLAADKPKNVIKLYASRQSQDLPKALRSAIKKHAEGELVVSLRATSHLDKSALINAVNYFNYNESLDGLLLKKANSETTSLTALFENFEYILLNRLQKAKETYAAKGFTSLEGSLWRRQVLLKALSKTKPQSSRLALPEATSLKYAANAQIRVKAANNVSRLIIRHYTDQVYFLRSMPRRLKLLPLKVVLIAAVLCLPVILTYFVYLAAKLNQPIFYAVAWGFFSCFMLLAIWGDEHLRRRAKLGYALLMPITQLWFYLVSFVSLLVLLLGLVTGYKPRDSRL